MRLRFTQGEKQSGLPRNLLKSGKWILLEDDIPLAPKPGEYEFLSHRGLEFTDVRGGFTVEKGARDIVTIEIPRSINMREEGWYSGDHASMLTVDVLKRWQTAEAIDMVIACQDVQPENSDVDQKAGSKSGRKSKKASETDEILAGENELGSKLSTQSHRLHSTGGSILFHPIRIANFPELSQDMNLSTMMDALSNEELTREYVTELEQLWARDVPVLLSSGNMKAAQILNSANTPDGDAKLQFKPVGSPTASVRLIRKAINKRGDLDVFSPIDEDDRIRFRNGRGVGLLSETLFWTILETGLRITPTAASGFGEVESHLGYNRTYVHCDHSVTPEQYWTSVKLGKTIVTNGPLLRVTINEEFPGATFKSQTGEPIELSISASLAVRDPVDYLDVVFNGETIYSAKLEDHYRKGEFPPLSIERSGWLVVRVVTAHDNLYRLATTAPFFFEFDGHSRVSAKSVEFMIQWLKSSSESLLKESKSKPELTSILTDAETFWRVRREQSNAP